MNGGGVWGAERLGVSSAALFSTSVGSPRGGGGGGGSTRGATAGGASGTTGRFFPHDGHGPVVARKSYPHRSHGTNARSLRRRNRDRRTRQTATSATTTSGVVATMDRMGHVIRSIG